MGDFLKKIIPVFIIFVISIASAVVLKEIQRQNVSANAIYNLTFYLTENYQYRQIVTNVLIFFYGLVLSVCIFHKRNFIFISAISYPMAVALWCILLCVYSILGVPCKLIFILPPFAAGILFICIRRNHELKQAIKNGNLVTALLLVSSIAIILSTGIFPGIVTGDSYYFIYQYGEIIAETGKMSFDLAGTYMTWAGAMPAFMSTFSALFGYETILVMHYMLVGSMLLLIGYEWYRSICKIKNTRNAVATALFCCFIMLLISPIEMIFPYQISNTYTMVYLVIFLIIGERYWVEGIEGREINAVDVVMCFLGIWLTLSRPEGFVLFAFLLFALSYVQTNQKKMIFVCVPSIIFETLYLIKVLIEQKNSVQNVSASRFSPIVVSLIIVAMLAELFYGIFYSNKYIIWVKEYLPIIIIVILPILSIMYGLFFVKDILKSDVEAIFSNFNKELWGYFPHFVIFAAFMILFIKRQFDTFKWMTIIGYIYLNLAFNFARHEILLKNFGDSYNRILLSIVPYIIFCLIDWMIIEKEK